MEQVEVEGLRVAYERAGSGPPLMFVHGFVGDGHSTWSRQVEALCDDFTVVAWDAPGAGLSDQPPEWFRLPDYADCLAAFVRAVGFDRAHLAGLSLGGALALALFPRHRTLPLSLVLVDAYAGWSGSFPPEKVNERLRACLDASTLPPDEFVAAMLPSMFSSSAPAEAVAGFATSVAGFSPIGFRVMAHALAEADLRPGLGHIDVPTLLLHGDRDVRAPLTVAHALQAAIPGARLVILPGVGHVSSVEAPELVSHEIREFLHRVAGDIGD